MYNQSDQKTEGQYEIKMHNQTGKEKRQYEMYDQSDWERKKAI